MLWCCRSALFFYEMSFHTVEEVNVLNIAFPSFLPNRKTCFQENKMLHEIHLVQKYEALSSIIQRNMEEKLKNKIVVIG